MRHSEKFEFTDPSTCNSETNLASMSGGKKNGGCYVSGVVGVVLTLLAVLIAVGVGLIVYLAAGDKDVTCVWGAGGTDTPIVASDAIKQECMDMAESGDTEICSSCPTTSLQPGGCDTTHMTTPTPGGSTATPMLTDVRLPTSVRPLHYDVRLQPNMYTGNPDTFTFNGTVRILIHCDEPSNNVTLHVNVLTVHSTTFKGQVMNRLDPFLVTSEKDEERQFHILRLSKNMRANASYIIEMDFTSPLKPDLHGLYLSQYTRGNDTVYLATTQLQPTDARKTFPCFDEPAIKATFNITLVRPSHLISISNMPIIDSSETWQADGMTYVADVYQMTPIMSTYLLAFVICDFNYTEKFTTKGVKYRAYSIPEAVNDTLYSLDVGVNILTYFENYFEIDYPLPKQDMIAIPDFAAGAMENWGLITYRETAMLYKEGVSTAANKERVAIVVSHELAHQWFGDLVTPSWWDDLWLNEGFASFVEYMGVDHEHPDWKMFDKFVVSDLQNAFSFDGLISSHPVYVPVANPDQINEIFDTISYAKGASIIRMMRHFLGEETFRKGLVIYLNERKYAAAFHTDLWTALRKQAVIDNKSHIDVAAIMDTWTLQMNFPVVTVTRDFSMLNTLHVRQDRYLVDPEAEDPGKFESPFGYRWSIPLTFTSSENPRFNQTDADVHWMMKEDEQKTFTLGSNDLLAVSNHTGWILANVMQYGYYRVNYQLGNWRNLAEALKTNLNVFPVSNRAQIINDAWNLAKSGNLPLEYALMTIEYMDQEREYVPWRAATTELSYVSTQLGLSPIRGAFKRFMLDKLRSPFGYYGLNIPPTTTHTQAYARRLIGSLACGYGLEDCLTQATSIYEQWMTTPNFVVNPDIKSIVYCYGVENGGWDEWNFALQKYKVEMIASEKALLLSVLSCSKEPWILNNLLYLILEENSVIRGQDALSVISYVSDQVVGRPLAWDFFRSHYNTLLDRFGTSFFAWTRVIGRVTNSFNTEFQLQQIEEFVTSKSGQLGTGERAFDQAKEKTRSNIKWMEANSGILQTWLSEKGYK